MDQKCILVVDNEDYIQEVAKVCLETIGGWRVITAGSGPECLKKAATDQPDAILLDMNMPGMDGVETCRALLADVATGHIPVIFLTGQIQPFDRLPNCEALGAIAKPFEPLELAIQVATTLNWPLPSA
jgi:CheY-like chemotaxis protein